MEGHLAARAVTALGAPGSLRYCTRAPGIYHGADRPLHLLDKWVNQLKSGFIYGWISTAIFILIIRKWVLYQRNAYHGVRGRLRGCPAAVRMHNIVLATYIFGFVGLTLRAVTVLASQLRDLAFPTGTRPGRQGRAGHSRHFGTETDGERLFQGEGADGHSDSPRGENTEGCYSFAVEEGGACSSWPYLMWTLLTTTNRDKAFGATSYELPATEVSSRTSFSRC